MIDLLYKPVDCDPASEDCSSEYDSVADDMQHDSFVVSGWWALLIVQIITGYSLMYYGFGVASERLNKRIRYVFVTLHAFPYSNILLIPWMSKETLHLYP